MDARLAEHAAADDGRLVVTFPPRLAKMGVAFFGVLFALFAGWIRFAPGGELPWLAVVAGTGCLFGVLLSLGQVLRPKVLVEADGAGVTVHRRRLEGGEARIPWSEVEELSYEEREVDRFLYKLVRLELRRPAEDPALRLVEDDDDIAHLDAFAAEPGGRELLDRLEQLRPRE